MSPPIAPCFLARRGEEKKLSSRRRFSFYEARRALSLEELIKLTSDGGPVALRSKLNGSVDSFVLVDLIDYVRLL